MSTHTIRQEGAELRSEGPLLVLIAGRGGHAVLTYYRQHRDTGFDMRR